MTLEEHAASVRTMQDKMPQSVERAMKRIAILMIADSRRKHLSGPKMPRGMGGGFDNSTLASKHGLIMRITSLIERVAGGVTGRIGTNLTNKGYPYPRAHEYGLGKMPERPWLRPAIAGRQQELADEIVSEILKSLGHEYT
jgi:hypothetical protein